MNLVITWRNRLTKNTVKFQRVSFSIVSSYVRYRTFMMLATPEFSIHMKRVYPIQDYCTRVKCSLFRHDRFWICKQRRIGRGHDLYRYVPTYTLPCYERKIYQILYIEMSRRNKCTAHMNNFTSSIVYVVCCPVFNAIVVANAFKTDICNGWYTSLISYIIF